MIQPKPPDDPIISVTDGEGGTMSISLRWTSDVWVYAKNLRIILLWLGFTGDTVDKVLTTVETRDEHEEGT